MDVATCRADKFGEDAARLGVFLARYTVGPSMNERRKSHGTKKLAPCTAKNSVV